MQSVIQALDPAPAPCKTRRSPSFNSVLCTPSPLSPLSLLLLPCNPASLPPIRCSTFSVLWLLMWSRARRWRERAWRQQGKGKRGRLPASSATSRICSSCLCRRLFGCSWYVRRLLGLAHRGALQCTGDEHQRPCHSVRPHLSHHLAAAPVGVQGLYAVGAVCSGVRCCAALRVWPSFCLCLLQLCFCLLSRAHMSRRLCPNLP